MQLKNKLDVIAIAGFVGAYRFDYDGERLILYKKTKDIGIEQLIVIENGCYIVNGGTPFVLTQEEFESL